MIPELLSPTEFPKTAAYQALTEKVAPNLTDPRILTDERLETYQSRCGDFTLFYALQRVDDAILEELKNLAEERRVIEQMEAMLRGLPINVSEGRSALHCAMRDFSFQDAKVERDALTRVIEEIDLQFDTMLFIGIGGSELGPHAICEALKPYWKRGKRVFYVGNVDPDEMTHVLSSIDPKKTVVVIVSKSGTTLETATNEARARDFFSKNVSSVRDHFIAVTCPHTPMDTLERYRACLHLFDYVGGRYSTTSVVGGILIAFMAGVDVFLQFLEGAREIDEIVLERSLKKNIPLLMALLGVWNRNVLEYPTVAIIPYSSALHRFPAHLQQCDMESNGKSALRTGAFVDAKTGPIVWGEPGTNAQHSFFQLLHQGTDIIPVEFIGFEESQYGEDFVFRDTSSQEKLLANMFAQGLALGQGMKSDDPNSSFLGNRPSLFLIGRRATAKAIGSLLAIYEHKIAFQGFLWGINSFDQQGVQLGKVLADRLLNGLRTDSPLSSVEEFFVSFIEKSKKNARRSP